MHKRKYVIACDSFKGSLTSLEAGNAIAAGILRGDPSADVTVIPVADGGEGTLDVILQNEGMTKTVAVHDPLGSLINARYAIFGGTAVIEMAEASGLTLIPPELRNPMLSTTYGTGELIADALKSGFRNFIVGIGGSATNDGGTGMLRALGFRFLDAEGNEIAHDVTALKRLAVIDDSRVIPGLREASFKVACDVDAPLCGPQGASHVFGPQKGADSNMIEELDSALRNYTDITSRHIGRDLSDAPGSGAGGGIAFALTAFLHATLSNGIDLILDILKFDSRIQGASLVITGEGRLDSQTCLGKAPYGILKRAKAQNIPVRAIGGSVDKQAVPLLLSLGFQNLYAATPEGMPLEEAMRRETAVRNLQDTASEIARHF